MGYCKNAEKQHPALQNDDLDKRIPESDFHDEAKLR